MTETGMSLGTPHYMSPEQAMGEREITARSDVYALGAVLYEMLTGEPPFTGTTAQAVVARVLTESPRPLVHPAPHHSAPRRGRGAHGAREAAGRPVRHGGRVRRRAQGPDLRQHAASLEAAPAPAAAAAAPRRRQSGRPALGRGRGRLATAAALWGWLRPGAGPAAHPVRACPPAGRGARAARRRRRRARRHLSRRPRHRLHRPGRRRARGSGSGGWTSSPPRRSPGTEGASSPFFSPDGRRIGFIKSGTAVRIASLDGAPTVTLSDKANTTGGDWSDDDWIYFEVDSGVARMRPAGGGRPSWCTRSTRTRTRSAPNGPSPCPAARASCSAPGGRGRGRPTSTSWR